ncbi:hypothetical protein Enr13x_61210 [Stieleria neptunia]|uniref:Nucleotidyltransferase n=1 Tax=Stieleria neptunia TaxID=2527979 RepID=A0A518HZD7_9BACT|nr:hypothetical protein [Stieleria neptunia]QDV46212.1 hypothetical protein Enr13x_61210 [Stieleria neptunia]
MTESISKVAERAGQFFMGQSPIHQAMLRLTKTLGEMQIPFAIAGAMAANAHGHRRTTADIDILIRGEDLEKFKQQYIGRGWVNKFEGSKNFRDAVCGVDIDALIVGGYPGDGLPKPVSFPEPERVSEVKEDGIPFVSLKTLLELKLASGMTASHRMQDMADVMNLIRANGLPKDFAENLEPYVAEKFGEMWQAAQISDEH